MKCINMVLIMLNRWDLYWANRLLALYMCGVTLDGQYVVICTIKISILARLILWNHSFSWEPLFSDCQNFAGSWWLYFVYNWIVALQYRTIHCYVKRSCGRKFVSRGNAQNLRTFIPHEHWWFHVHYRSSLVSNI